LNFVVWFWPRSPSKLHKSTPVGTCVRRFSLLRYFVVMNNQDETRSGVKKQESGSIVRLLPFRVPRPRRVCEGGSSARKINSKTTNACLLAGDSSHSNPAILIGTRVETENRVRDYSHSHITNSNRYRFAHFFTRKYSPGQPGIGSTRRPDARTQGSCA
jgi:hypothetical protein